MNTVSLVVFLLEGLEDVGDPGDKEVSGRARFDKKVASREQQQALGDSDIKVHVNHMAVSSRIRSSIHPKFQMPLGIHTT